MSKRRNRMTRGHTRLLQVAAGLTAGAIAVVQLCSGESDTPAVRFDFRPHETFGFFLSTILLSRPSAVSTAHQLTAPAQRPQPLVLPVPLLCGDSIEPQAPGERPCSPSPLFAFGSVACPSPTEGNERLPGESTSADMSLPHALLRPLLDRRNRLPEPLGPEERRRPVAAAPRLARPRCSRLPRARRAGEPQPPLTAHMF